MLNVIVKKFINMRVIHFYYHFQSADSTPSTKTSSNLSPLKSFRSSLANLPEPGVTRYAYHPWTCRHPPCYNRIVFRDQPPELTPGSTRGVLVAGRCWSRVRMPSLWKHTLTVSLGRVLPSTPGKRLFHYTECSISFFCRPPVSAEVVSRQEANLGGSSEVALR